MEAHNLDTASDYINNLLLARGLLKNGKPIDFAKPTTVSDGIEGTMTRTINLIHDLVMRRDREAEQHENLANTIRSLRNTEAKQRLEIERLEARVDDLSRSLALTEGQERAFKVNIRNAETTIRMLKEQVQRMKSTVQHIRAQYTTDIRKRDLEMQKLKGRLTERTRGRKDAPGVTTITVTPPSNPTPLGQKSSEGGEGLDTPGYSLRQETTEFLTQLCQSLSDENDALIRLAQDSIRTLKELQGLTESGAKDISQGSDALEVEIDVSMGPVPPYETLSAEMSYVLEQLRALLTNPSFVSLEEVEVRDNEISRLRDGWEKMEGKWKEAVAMMDNWHKRMAGGGDAVNIDELKLGMTLGSSIHQSAPLEESQVSILDDEDDSQSALEDESLDVLNVQQESANAVQRRTVRFAKRDQNILEECSGNEQPKRLPQKVSTDQLLENRTNKAEHARCVFEESSTTKAQKSRPRKETNSKVRPQVGVLSLSFDVFSSLPIVLEPSNYDTPSYWCEAVDCARSRRTAE
ncbi:hypothetical protein PRK78_005314 [Emydomyces testavorans]|uniref:NIMA interactive protein n=1 Tax=Emydomyces testavorans TaxID=2070801 RepID=A0AAF0IJX4_9EURO|nr:hypothetical protein PRK78_005314 [Emydomyces testavorans]